MTILVLEDESAIREVETAYLRRAGYEVVEAQSGSEALSLFREQKIDLAILDVNVPHISGLDVCKAIRETSTMPILIVTARNDDMDEVLGLELGADDYMKKPFNPSVLVARVQALLRRFGKRKLVYGTLTIDPATATVTKNNRSLQLTTTQLNILCVLASQPKIVMSRAQLIDSIYAHPSEHEIYDRTIDAHIKGLRRQIEDDPAHPTYVRTVIGRGYCFHGDIHG